VRAHAARPPDRSPPLTWFDMVQCRGGWVGVGACVRAWGGARGGAREAPSEHTAASAVAILHTTTAFRVTVQVRVCARRVQDGRRRLSAYACVLASVPGCIRLCAYACVCVCACACRLTAAPLSLAQEAARLQREHAAQLRAARRLILVCDLDQTLVHASVDPSIERWLRDEDAQVPQRPTTHTYIQSRAAYVPGRACVEGDGPRGVLECMCVCTERQVPKRTVWWVCAYTCSRAHVGRSGQLVYRLSLDDSPDVVHYLRPRHVTLRCLRPHTRTHFCVDARTDC
jgi:hypothetical protein